MMIAWSTWIDQCPSEISPNLYCIHSLYSCTPEADCPSYTFGSNRTKQSTRMHCILDGRQLQFESAVTVKACEDTSAAGALETRAGMMLAGRPGAVSGPGRPRSVNVSAAECACHCHLIARASTATLLIQSLKKTIMRAGTALQGTAGPADIILIHFNLPRRNACQRPATFEYGKQSLANV